MITNYSELKTAVANWLMRDDLTNRIPEFIALAEAHFNRRLRVKGMVKRSRATATSQFLALPNDWREARNIQRISDGKPLDYLTPVEIDRYRKAVDEGSITSNKGPEKYSILDGEIELAPAPTSSDPYEIELLYFSSLAPLSDQNATNWLLDRDPDLYLYGALVHSAPFLKEDERIQVWAGLMAGIINDMNAEYERARYSGAPLTRPKTANW